MAPSSCSEEPVMRSGRRSDKPSIECMETDVTTSLTVRDNPEQHRFEIDLGDGSLAVAEYTLPQGKIMFTHTEVPPAHEGEGVGSELIRAGLAAARERGLKVIPV